MVSRDVALMHAEGIRKQFGAVTALSSASLSVGRGEHVAIVGDNGAGKSTLIKILTGAETPDAGTMWFDGAEVAFGSPMDARLAGIETVYQTLALAEELDIIANLFLGRELVKWKAGALSVLDKKQMKQRGQKMIEETGVQIQDLSQSLKGLSGGQRQGVAIARAVGWGSQLVVLDEPTAALGVQETQYVEGIVRGLKQRGVAVLLISHDMRQVLTLADRVYVLRQGRVAGVREAKSTSPTELVALITGAASDDAVPPEGR
jgi:ABC-type sugar transport system ATPase subunit